MTTKPTESLPVVDVLDIIHRVALFNGGLVADDLRKVGQRVELLLLAAREVTKWHAIFDNAEDQSPDGNADDALHRLLFDHLPALRDALATMLPLQVCNEDAP